MTSINGYVKVVLVDPKHGKTHHYRDTVMKGWENKVQDRLQEVNYELLESAQLVSEIIIPRIVE